MSEYHSTDHPPPEINQEGRPRPALTIDYELFDEILENSEASDEEKKEFVDTICSIAFAFMGLGFDVHPVQQVCGQEIDLSRLLPDGLLESKDTPLSEPFSEAAAKSISNEEGRAK